MYARVSHLSISHFNNDVHSFRLVKTVSICTVQVSLTLLSLQTVEILLFRCGSLKTWDPVPRNSGSDEPTWDLLLCGRLHVWCGLSGPTFAQINNRKGFKVQRSSILTPLTGYALTPEPSIVLMVNFRHFTVGFNVTSKRCTVWLSAANWTNDMKTSVSSWRQSGTVCDYVSYLFCLKVGWPRTLQHSYTNDSPSLNCIIICISFNEK